MIESNLFFFHFQDKTREARVLLTQIHNGFTEGFDATGLKEAESSSSPSERANNFPTRTRGLLRMVCRFPSQTPW